MAKTARRGLVLAALLAIPFAVGGCGGNATTGPSTSGPTAGPPGNAGPGEAPPSGGRGPGSGWPGPGPGDRGGKPTPIREIMTKLARGPQSLTPTIGRELQADPPAWETIQPQTKEYAELAGSMSKYDPPKGSKESWTKHTSSYAEAAAALDRASQARDKDAALAAHKTLAGSCTACHQEHRPRGPGGPGGFGGFGGGGPGGFGGPPQPGQILPPFFQERLNLTPEQKKQLDALQKETQAELDKILTDEQKKQLKEMREGFGRGGPPGFGGPRGPRPGDQPPGP